jgi:phage FluMu protein gp41
MAQSFLTETEFELPRGYIDADGSLHRKGTMRMASAADEILSMKDHRVMTNPAYLPVIILSRVVTRLGTVDVINTSVIENLFSADFAYLQQVYSRLNDIAPQPVCVTCPHCGREFVPDSSQ